MRKLVSKGKHTVTDIERFMKLVESPNDSIGVMLDGEPNMERGDYIRAVTENNDNPKEKE